MGFRITEGKEINKRMNALYSELDFVCGKYDLTEVEVLAVLECLRLDILLERVRKNE